MCQLVHSPEQDEELKKLTGSGIGKGCHPDPGLGRFAAKLSLEDWMALNTAQRAAGNYLEQQTSIITLLLLNGCFNPIFTAATGAVYMVGRYILHLGLPEQGGRGAPWPRLRDLHAVLHDPLCLHHAQRAAHDRRVCLMPPDASACSGERLPFSRHHHQRHHHRCHRGYRVPQANMRMRLSDVLIIKPYMMVATLVVATCEGNRSKAIALYCFISEMTPA